MRRVGDNLSQPRDTVNYVLFDGRKVVYHGITNNLKRRIAEHKGDGKKFTRFSFSAKKTRKSALKHEAEVLKRYRRNQGKFPKYNDVM